MSPRQMPSVIAGQPHQAKERAVAVRQRARIFHAVTHQFPSWLHRGVHSEPDCQHRLVVVLGLIAQLACSGPPTDVEAQAFVRLQSLGEFPDGGLNDDGVGRVAVQKVRLSECEPARGKGGFDGV